MNRRNVLLGLGTAAAGSGIVFGSGAFTQVQADRQLAVEIAGDDSDAFFGIAVSETGDLIDGSPDDTDVAFEIDVAGDLGELQPDSFLELEGEFTFTDNTEGDTEATDLDITLTEIVEDGTDEFESEESQGVLKFVPDGAGTIDERADLDGDAFLASDGSSVTLDELASDDTPDRQPYTLFLDIDEQDVDDFDRARFEVEEETT